MVKSHVECSSELVWQCVKKNNAYVRASVNRTRFSAERGNVTSKHGFSSSGATQIFFCGDLPFFLLAPSAGSFPSFFVQRKREGGKEKRTRPPFLFSLFSLLSSLSFSLSLICGMQNVNKSRKKRTKRGGKHKRMIFVCPSFFFVVVVPFRKNGVKTTRNEEERVSFKNKALDKTREVTMRRTRAV